VRPGGVEVKKINASATFLFVAALLRQQSRSFAIVRRKVMKLTFDQVRVLGEQGNHRLERYDLLRTRSTSNDLC